jgi:hypothetical protein
VNFLNEFRSRLSTVRVDSIGIGHGFASHLRVDCRFPVEAINVAMPCESQPSWGENDPSRRFVNVKASMYQAVADAFEHDQVEGLTDEKTIGQLAGLLTEFDSHGRMKIESKADARKRGVPSPDRAEALMLALGRPPARIEYYSIRDLSRLASRTYEPSRAALEANPYWGFTEVPYKDDDDDQPFRRRWPRDWRGF